MKNPVLSHDEETQLIFSCEGSWALKLDVQNNN